MDSFQSYATMTGAEFSSNETNVYGTYPSGTQSQDFHSAYPCDSIPSNPYVPNWSETYPMSGYHTGVQGAMSSNALDLDISSRMQSASGMSAVEDGQGNLGFSSAISASPSVPTPDQLLRMLGGPQDMYDSYMTSEPLPRTVAPSDLHSASVSPAHSRDVSMGSHYSYDQGYNSRCISANTEALFVKASDSQYSSHLFALNQVGESLSPQSALLYSPLSSRRTSFQPGTPSSLSAHSRSPSIMTCYSVRDDSGSSVYSPYTHGRTVSSSTSGASPIVIPITPLIRANSVGTDGPSTGSPAWSASSSTGGTFSKFPLFSAAGGPSKKRKRANVPVPPAAKKAISVDSSEDEYVGAEDADASDEDYDGEFGARKSKAKKVKSRTMKKPKLAAESHGHGICSWTHSRAGSGFSTQYGADIKVEQLIPIDRETVSCPHCGFIPGNRRFSDLKRHWEAHLVKEAKGKVRWVCLTCGDVEEIVVQEQQDDGSMITKNILEYIPKVPVLKKYTRKDSARRHWKQDHGEKGMTWSDGLVVQVDRVRGE